MVCFEEKLLCDQRDRIVIVCEDVLDCEICVTSQTERLFTPVQEDLVCQIKALQLIIWKEGWVFQG